MSNEYMKLETAPSLHHPGYPSCGACAVETELEDGLWQCPSCGTTWPADRLEADPDEGELYEDWSGEELTGQTVPVDHAWLFALYRGEDRESRIKRWKARNDA